MTGHPLARRTAILALTTLLLGGGVLPAAADHEPARCPMHAPHAGPHLRESCQMDRLGAVEISANAGIGQIEVRGNLAAVVQREDGLVALVDVSDPAAPRVLGRYDGNTGRSEVDDPLDGDVAFSHDGRFLFYARQTHDYSNEGLHALDVSDPTRPVQVSYAPAGGSLRVAYHRDGEDEYVITADAITGIVIHRFVRTAIGGTLIPVFVDAQPLLKVGGPASAGLVVDPRDPILGIPLLYVTTGRTGLQVFDLSSPAEPVLLGSWTQTAGLADIEVSATTAGRTVYAATEYWFAAATAPRIIELEATNLGAITERRRFSPGDPDYGSGVSWRVQGIELSDGLLYLAHSHAGLGVVDTCCLDAPPRGSTTDLGDGNTGGEFPNVSPYAMDVEVANGIAWVTDASTGTLSAFRFDPTLEHPQWAG